LDEAVAQLILVIFSYCWLSHTTHVLELYEGGESVCFANWSPVPASPFKRTPTQPTNPVVNSSLAHKHTFKKTKKIGETNVDESLRNLPKIINPYSYANKNMPACNVPKPPGKDRTEAGTEGTTKTGLRYET